MSPVPGWLVGVQARNGAALSTSPAPTVHANEWGAAGDNDTDNTVAINAAIAALSAMGGGVVVFPPGVYLASQIVLRRNVILDGGHVAAVQLKQIAGSNVDFIISANFAALTGTGAHYPSTPTVPAWFGLRNIHVNAIGQTAGTPRAIAWYGHAQIMDGVVLVENARGTNIYTECSNTFDTSFQWTAQVEGHFDTVISLRAGGKGWHFRGPLNSRIRNYLCINAAGGDWGWYSESGATYSGVTDFVDQIHVYTESATNRNGIRIGAGMTAGSISADGVSLTVASDGPNVFLHTVYAYLYDSASVIAITSSTAIDFLGVHVAAPGGFTCVTWSANGGYVAGANFVDAAGAATTKALSVTGGLNQFNGLNILDFAGTGSVAIANSGFENAFAGIINNCKTGFAHTGSGNTRADVEIFTNAGQSSVSGSTPGTGDRMDLRESGVKVAGTYSQALSSGGVSLTITTVQTITLAHGCLYTPTARNVQLTFSTPTVTDFVWDIPPMFVSADATNLTIKCKLGTASGTGGATGSIAASVRMGA